MVSFTFIELTESLNNRPRPDPQARPSRRKAGGHAAAGVGVRSPRHEDAAPTDLAFSSSARLPGVLLFLSAMSQSAGEHDQLQFQKLISLFGGFLLFALEKLRACSLPERCWNLPLLFMERGIGGRWCSRCRSIHQPGKPSPAKDSALSQCSFLDALQQAKTRPLAIPCRSAGREPTAPRGGGALRLTRARHCSACAQRRALLARKP